MSPCARSCEQSSCHFAFARVIARDCRELRVLARASCRHGTRRRIARLPSNQVRAGTFSGGGQRTSENPLHDDADAYAAAGHQRVPETLAVVPTVRDGAPTVRDGKPQPLPDVGPDEQRFNVDGDDGQRHATATLCRTFQRDRLAQGTCGPGKSRDVLIPDVLDDHVGRDAERATLMPLFRRVKRGSKHVKRWPCSERIMGARRSGSTASGGRLGGAVETHGSSGSARVLQQAFNAYPQSTAVATWPSGGPEPVQAPL